MGDNILFARPRWDYGSYSDLWSLIKLSGFPLVYIDEVDWAKDQVVILPVKNAEWSGVPDRHAARLIWWTFERYHQDAPIMDMANPFVPQCVDELWASDRAMAERMGARYLFLGGHEHFANFKVVPKKYDVIFLMYFSARRQPLRAMFKGFRIADPDGGCWATEREEKINQTRLMVTCHQDDDPYCEPIRYMLAACHAIPLLSEQCADSGYWEAGRHYVAVPFEGLAHAARMLLDNNLALRNLAANAWRLCCKERTFRSQVEQALSERVTA